MDSLTLGAEVVAGLGVSVLPSPDWAVFRGWDDLLLDMVFQEECRDFEMVVELLVGLCWLVLKVLEEEYMFVLREIAHIYVNLMSDTLSDECVHFRLDHSGDVSG